MIIPPLPPNEAERLQTLLALKILDTPVEERFDRLTRMAAQFFGVPISLITLLDAERQWFKSAYGLGIRELPREVSFCGYAINQQGVMVVPDATLDERFIDNPVVGGDFGVRFYAGHPIYAVDGSALGTICVLDNAARDIPAEKLDALKDWAKLVEQEIGSYAVGKLNRRLMQTSVTLEAMVQASPVAVVVQDSTGCVKTWSPAAEKLLGWSEADTLGHLVPYIVPTAYEAYQAQIKRVLAGVRLPPQEMNLVNKAGQSITARCTLRLIRDPYSNSSQLLSLLEDVSQITALERREQKASQLTQALLSTLAQRADAVLILQEERCIKVNATALELIGLSETELLQTDSLLSLIQSEDKAQAKRALLQCGSDAGQTPVQVELSIRHPTEGAVRVHASFAAINTAEAPQVLLVCRALNQAHIVAQPASLPDVRAVVRTEILKSPPLLSQEQLLEKLDKLSVGFAHIARTGQILTASRTCCGMMGYPLERLKQLSVDEIFHPEDMPIDTAALKQLITGDIERFSFEKRSIRGDGSLLWVLVSMTLHRDIEDDSEYFFCIVEDIQTRKNTALELERAHADLEQRVAQRTSELQRSNEILAFEVQQREEVERGLRASEERIRCILEQSQDAFVAMSAEGIITDWNREAEATFGWSREEAIGQMLANLIMPERFREAHARGLLQFLKTGTSAMLEKRLELTALRRSGEEFPIEMSLGFVRIQDTQLFTAFLHDITDRKNYEMLLKHRALHDPLTGLPNRAALFAQLIQAMARAQRTERTLAVMFLDLDRFKQINDCQGHDVGDQLLVLFAQRLKDQVRQSDTVSRLAGDEFVILLENLTPNDTSVRAVASKILQSMEQPFVINNCLLSCSTSIGIALPVSGQETPEDLLKQADQAMYAAKNAGRNQYQVYLESRRSA